MLNKEEDMSSVNNSDLSLKIRSWIRAARLQFFPMAFIAYSMGAFAADKTVGQLNILVYLIGYLVLFLIELCAIMVNDYYDYESDHLNRNYSMFTGGSRVLVDRMLEFREVRNGIAVVLLFTVIVGFVFLRINHDVSSSLIIGLFFAGIVLALGYTMPPIKFSHRGLGEVVVGITHSFYLVLCGYAFQAGTLGQSLPWMLSIPLFFAVLAAIVLAGLPDRIADEATNKKTLAVIFGPKKAVLLAGFFVLFAAVSALLIYHIEIIHWTLIVAAILIIIHGMVLSRLLYLFLKSKDYDRRIDHIMGSALSYIIWFGLIPLLLML
jgi:1,4-dihydroxy-2-naphthoate polyprenyltransferase